MLACDAVLRRISDFLVPIPEASRAAKRRTLWASKAGKRRKGRKGKRFQR